MYKLESEGKKFPSLLLCEKETPLALPEGSKALFLLPVVPDVLHIVIVFHDVDELFHQSDLLLGLQLLIVLRNHFQLIGKLMKNKSILNFFL